MRIRKNILLITIPLILIIVACFGVYQRYVFQVDKVCANLIQSGYYPTASHCSFSGNDYDVISKVFPIGEVNYEYVMTGMSGFRILSEYTGVSEGVYNSCPSGEEIKVVDIETIPGFIRGQESFEFFFCKNLLIDLYWNN